MCKDDAVSHYNNVSNDILLSSSSDGTQFEGTVVAATQIEGADDATAVMRITPYNALSDCHCCEAGGGTIAQSNVAGVDPTHKRWIRQYMLDNWGIQSPNEFQIQAVHSIAFCRDRLVYLIAKTGLGKSAVSLTVGSMQNGVTLTKVLLIGLGSDQVSKSTNEANMIESYHLDKHRGIDSQVLRDCLLSLNWREADHILIYLYAFPHSLQDVTCVRSLTLICFGSLL